MIENRTAVDNIEEILSVDGLEFVIIGSMDLSVSLGEPTNTASEAFTKHAETVKSVCRDKGVPYGQLGAPDASARELIEAGASLVSVGSDIGSIRSHLSSEVAEIHKYLE